MCQVHLKEERAKETVPPHHLNAMWQIAFRKSPQCQEWFSMLGWEEVLLFEKMQAQNPLENTGRYRGFFGT